MGREKTIQLVLVIAVVILLLLNVVQFMAASNKDSDVKQEDVPMQIPEIKGDDWESMVGKTVTVDGYYVENNGIGLLITDPGLLQIKRPMNTTEFIRIDVPLPSDAVPLGKYSIKGKVQASIDVEEKIYLQKENYALKVMPINTGFQQYVIDYDLIVPVEHSATKYAVLISGGWTKQDAWPSFWNDLKLVYSVLVQQYFYDPDNIIVIFNDGVALDNGIPVDYAATSANIDTALDHLSDVMTSEDKLLLFVTDHGGQWENNGKEATTDAAGLDEFICLWNKAGYFDDRLDMKLDAISFSRAIIIMDLCHAGGYTWDLSGANRIIIASSTEAGGSYDNPNVPNGDLTYNLFNAFQNKWWAFADKDSNGRISVAEAFNYAAVTSISAQQPNYDDNGDKVAHYSNIPNGGMVEDEGKLGDTYL